MEDSKGRIPPQRVWLRTALRNNESLSMNIPAGIRRALDLHQNCTLVVELVGAKMTMYKLDELKASAVTLPSLKLAKRKKSWRRSPAEHPPVRGGYLVEEPDPKPSNR